MPNGSSVQVTAVHGSIIYGVENGFAFSMDAKGHLTLLKLPNNNTALPSGVNAKGVVVGTYQIRARAKALLSSRMAPIRPTPRLAATTIPSTQSMTKALSWVPGTSAVKRFSLLSSKVGSLNRSSSRLLLHDRDGHQRFRRDRRLVLQDRKRSARRIPLRWNHLHRHSHTPNAYACNAGHVSSAGDLSAAALAAARTRPSAL